MNISLVIRHCREAASSFAVALALCALAQRAVADGFAYQGVLTEVGGAVPADKNKTVEFRIYNVATGGEALWGRACNVLLDENGLFNSELSDTSGTAIDGVPSTGLASILARNAGSTLYIGLLVNGSSGEISPRQAIMSVPYAMHAENAASASGDFSVAGKATISTLQTTGASTFAAVSAASITASGKIRTETSGSFEGYGTVPLRTIVMWGGSASENPDGWHLCDGTAGTPDLRGRFIVGAGQGQNGLSYYSAGSKGGEEKHQLTVAEMPSHNHTYKFNSYDLAAAWKDARNFFTVSKGKTDQEKSTESTGGNQAHENRPPYYALCYIMRVK